MRVDRMNPEPMPVMEPFRLFSPVECSLHVNPTGILTDCSIRPNMDGQGRCRDNIFIERLWKTVKYHKVHLKAYVLFDNYNYICW